MAAAVMLMYFLLKNRLKGAIEHPNSVVAHPECIESVRDLADEVCSTEKMVSFCSSNASDTFIILTETGMMHRLTREIPNKTFVAGPTGHCACNDWQIHGR